jgi:hypothetical protein
VSEPDASQNGAMASNVAKHRKKQFLTSLILLFQNETRGAENFPAHGPNEPDRTQMKERTSLSGVTNPNGFGTAMILRASFVYNREPPRKMRGSGGV